MAYQTAVAITGFEDKEINIKNKLFKKYVIGLLNGKVDLNIQIKFKRYMKKDFSIISKADELMRIESEKFGYDMGDLYEPNLVAISEYDYN